MFICLHVSEPNSQVLRDIGMIFFGQVLREPEIQDGVHQPDLTLHPVAAKVTVYRVGSLSGGMFGPGAGSDWVPLGEMLCLVQTNANRFFSTVMAPPPPPPRKSASRVTGVPLMGAGGGTVTQQPGNRPGQPVRSVVNSSAIHQGANAIYDAFRGPLLTHVSVNLLFQDPNANGLWYGSRAIWFRSVDLNGPRGVETPMDDSRNSWYRRLDGGYEFRVRNRAYNY